VCPSAPSPGKSSVMKITLKDRSLNVPSLCRFLLERDCVAYQSRNRPPAGVQYLKADYLDPEKPGICCDYKVMIYA